VILAYVLYNVAYAALAFPAGILADRTRPRWVLVGGYIVFGLVCAGMLYTILARFRINLIRLTRLEPPRREGSRLRASAATMRR